MASVQLRPILGISMLIHEPISPICNRTKEFPKFVLAFVHRSMAKSISDTIRLFLRRFCRWPLWPRLKFVQIVPFWPKTVFRVFLCWLFFQQCCRWLVHSFSSKIVKKIYFVLFYARLYFPSRGQYGPDSNSRSLRLILNFLCFPVFGIL